jgi:hypothetical protein
MVTDHAYKLVELVFLNMICFFLCYLVCELNLCMFILYLNFYVKFEKTFQHSFKRLNVKKLVHNVLMFYRFNNHG